MLRPDERDSLLDSHPSARKFVRRLLGTEEFIDGKGRFCLWIADADLREASQVPFIAGRIAAVRTHREDSDREATNRLAARSHQFGEVRHQDGVALLIPLHTSENREYIPIGFITSTAIITNSAIAVYQADPSVFGIVSSKMHMVWSRAVAGGLETRVRYSSSICYNNFPFPQLSLAQRERVAQCAEAVLIAREHHPEKTIAWLYDPDTMPPDLLAAHRKLDEAVEQCYRAKPFTSDEQRLEYLFGLYEQMTAAEVGELFAPPAPTKAKAKTKKA